MQRRTLTEFGFWIVVLCAVATTTIVLRREMAVDTASLAAQSENWQPTYIDGWEDALAVGIRSGSEDAPIQVVEFGDFQCPYCARFEETIQVVKSNHPKLVAFTFAPFPLDYHEFAISAQHAVECAHLQGRFDEMRSLLFKKHRLFGSIAWTEFAAEVGVANIDKFSECLDDPRRIERIVLSRELADRIGVRGTPTVIVNGWKFPMSPSVKDFETIVNNVNADRPPLDGMSFAAGSSDD